MPRVMEVQFSANVTKAAVTSRAWKQRQQRADYSCYGRAVN